MSFVNLFLLGWLFAVLLMLVLFEVQRRTTNATIVDLGWTGSIGLLSTLYAVLAKGYAPRRALVGAMGFLWSARLLAHLIVDRIGGKPEDGRYRDLRKRWAGHAQRNFLFFFQAQAFLAVVFSVPFLTVASNSAEGLTVWDLLGAIVWLIAVCGEGVADWQLYRFRNEPANKGHTCRAGLWKYSRHPNYFFEWLHWWSYVLMAVGTFWFWLNISFPMVMLFFLFKVTGIPETEAQALRSRGENYRHYQETTSVFIPWFPRKERS